MNLVTDWKWPRNAHKFTIRYRNTGTAQLNGNQNKRRMICMKYLIMMNSAEQMKSKNGLINLNVIVDVDLQFEWCASDSVVVRSSIDEIEYLRQFKSQRAEDWQTRIHHLNGISRKEGSNVRRGHEKMLPCTGKTVGTDFTVSNLRLRFVMEFLISHSQSLYGIFIVSKIKNWIERNTYRNSP